MLKDGRKKNYQLLRKAFVMSVEPDKHEEYQCRHDRIWPELKLILKAHGAHNYSIFLDKNTSNLFGYVEIENEEMWQAIANNNVCSKWWEYMADIMETNADGSPTATILDEVFHLD